MATPRPPSTWTRVQLVPGGTSHPEEVAQLARRRQEARKTWEDAVRAIPAARALKAHIEGEALPHIDRDIAQAEADREAAMGRLMGRIAAEQNYEVLEQYGQPAVFISAEDQQNDVDLVVAEGRLKQLRAGRKRLLEHLEAADQTLSTAAYQRPPED